MSAAPVLSLVLPFRDRALMGRGSEEEAVGTPDVWAELSFDLAVHYRR